MSTKFLFTCFPLTRGLPAFILEVYVLINELVVQVGKLIKKEGKDLYIYFFKYCL